MFLIIVYEWNKKRVGNEALFIELLLSFIKQKQNNCHLALFKNNQFKGYLWFDDYVLNATQCLLLFSFHSSLSTEQKCNYFKRFFEVVNESSIRWRWSIKSFRWVKFVKEKLKIEFPMFTVDGTCCRFICIVCDRIEDECSSNMGIGEDFAMKLKIVRPKSGGEWLNGRSFHHSCIEFLEISTDRNELCSDHSLHFEFVFVFFLTLNSWVIGCCHIWFIFKQPRQFTANKFVK